MFLELLCQIPKLNLVQNADSGLQAIQSMN